jgi:hypothetical protein
VVIFGAPLQSGEPAITQLPITNYGITVTVHLIALHGSAFGITVTVHLIALDGSAYGDFDRLQLSALSP